MSDLLTVNGDILLEHNPIMHRNKDFGECWEM